jgi:hypothetical protein
MIEPRSQDWRAFWEIGIHYYYYYIIKRQQHAEAVFDDLDDYSSGACDVIAAMLVDVNKIFFIRFFCL